MSRLRSKPRTACVYVLRSIIIISLLSTPIVHHNGQKRSFKRQQLHAHTHATHNHIKFQVVSCSFLSLHVAFCAQCQCPSITPVSLAFYSNALKCVITFSFFLTFSPKLFLLPFSCARAWQQQEKFRKQQREKMSRGIFCVLFHNLRFFYVDNKRRVWGRKKMFYKSQDKVAKWIFIRIFS